MELFNIKTNQVITLNLFSSTMLRFFTALSFVATSLLLSVSLLNVAHASALDQFDELKNAGLLVVATDGTELVNTRGDDAFIPASTTKIVTGFLALEQWGEQHRFTTNFYFDEATATLWVKGSGDPFLVSEELALIAGQLATRLQQNGVTEVKRIGLDMTLFANNIILPGTSSTNNPYDAIPSAIAANFNTVNLRKTNGQIRSAEAQTPLTPFAKTLAQRPKNAFKNGKLRVNTGRNANDAAKNFGQLLTAFMNQMQLPTQSTLVLGSVPTSISDVPLYQHQNSKTVGEMVQPMMKYSTNFIANQLILILAAETVAIGQPVTADHVKTTLQQQLAARLNWMQPVFIEGAGLSRQNQVSPRELVELLEAFRPYKHLLPEVEPGVFAKSGTLSGVSTLAGYLVIDGEWHAFALMMNQSVPYKLRNRIARELRNSL